MTNTCNLEDIRICHVNCQSILAHLDEFRNFFENSDFHVICMSETWLRPEVSDDMLRLRGFSLFRCDRVGRVGGGVAFYLMNGLRASIILSSPGGHAIRPEFMIAEILIDNSAKLLLAVVYRPPNSGYLNEFFQAFIQIQNNYRHSVILGDFNVDMNQVTFDSQQLSAFVTASNLHLVPYDSTHHLRNSSTFIDLCIIDDNDKLKDYGQHDMPFLSAHDLIYIEYKFRIQKRYNRHVIFRNWNALDADSIRLDMENIDWTDLFKAQSIEDKLDIFNSRMLDIFNLHVPLVQRNFKNLPATWLTEEVRSVMRERDCARRIWRRHKCNLLYDRYKILRNRAQNLVREAKKSYYLDYFSRATRAGEIWNGLRHLGLVKVR